MRWFVIFKPPNLVLCCASLSSHCSVNVLRKECKTRYDWVVVEQPHLVGVIECRRSWCCHVCLFVQTCILYFMLRRGPLVRERLGRMQLHLWGVKLRNKYIQNHFGTLFCMYKRYTPHFDPTMHKLNIYAGCPKWTDINCDSILTYSSTSINFHQKRNLTQYSHNMQFHVNIVEQM